MSGSQDGCGQNGRQLEPQFDADKSCYERNSLTALEQGLGISFNRAAELAWRFSYSLTGNGQDADDLCQIVFERLARRAARGSLKVTQGAASAYLCVALVNAWRDEHAKATAQRRGGGDLPDVIDVDIPESQVPDQQGGDPADRVADEEWMCALIEAVKALPPDYRIPLERVIEGGSTMAEIGRELGLAPGTLRGRLASARSKVRSALRRAGWEVGS
jgi:RNA polymerase sigma factor (sigma-70 family)